MAVCTAESERCGQDRSAAVMEVSEPDERKTGQYTVFSSPGGMKPLCFVWQGTGSPDFTGFVLTR